MAQRPRPPLPQRRPRTGDGATDRALAERGDDATSLAIETPAGQLVGPFVFVANQPLVVSHGLRAIPRGWFASRPRQGYPQPQEQTRDSKTLTLVSTTSGTCDLWVIR